MKTIVYQSFRTSEVPAWIESCMGSVRAWAAQRGYSYRFWDDSFFDFIPPELCGRAARHRCLMADFARVAAARKLLAEGWDRTIWVDADVLVFDPGNFEIDLATGYAFCREIWLHRTVLGHPQFELKVNNAVAVFCQGERLTDFYLDAAEIVLRGAHELTPFSIGVDWLSGLKRVVDFPLLTSVGMFGPEMSYRYLQDDGRFLRPYLRYQSSRVAAANLCLSGVGQAYRFPGTGRAWKLTDGVIQGMVDFLMSDHGASLNRWFVAGYTPHGSEFDHPLSPYMALRNIRDGLRGLRRSLRGPVESRGPSRLDA